MKNRGEGWGEGERWSALPWPSFAIGQPPIKVQEAGTSPSNSMARGESARPFDTRTIRAYSFGARVRTARTSRLAFVCSTPVAQMGLGPPQKRDWNFLVRGQSST